MRKKQCGDYAVAYNSLGIQTSNVLHKLLLYRVYTVLLEECCMLA